MSNTYIIKNKQTNKLPKSQLETQMNNLHFVIGLMMTFSNINTSGSLQRPCEGKVSKLKYRIHDII